GEFCGGCGQEGPPCTARFPRGPREPLGCRRLRTHNFWRNAVPKRSLAAILFAAFVLMLGIVAVGCGDDDDATSGGSCASNNTQEEEKPAIKVGLVTDIGGLNDRSFNQLANEGLERDKSELGIERRVWR